MDVRGPRRRAAVVPPWGRAPSAAALGLVCLLGWSGCAAEPRAEPTPPAASLPSTPVGAAAARPVGPERKPSGDSGGPTRSSSPLSPAVPVRVGVVGSVREAGLYLALARGYFAEEGLTVELVPSHGDERLTALVAGTLDAVTASVDPPLFDALARNDPPRLVESVAVVTADDRSAGLAVRKELVDRGQVRSVGDLRGRRLGVAAEDAGAPLYLARALARGGLGIADVDVRVLAAVEMGMALANGALDAAWLAEPYLVLAEGQGVSRTLVYVGDVAPGAIVDVLVLAAPFAQARPAAARFVTAHLRGQRDVERAFARPDSGKAAVVDALMRYTAIKDPTLYAHMTGYRIAPDGGVDGRALDAQQDEFVRLGAQGAKVDLSAALDPSYVEYARERLAR